MEVGSGRKTRFWEDNWVQGGPLKERFPRLFSISEQQGAVIGDCRFWDGMEWIWNFKWRRDLFQWELKLVHQLHERLGPVKLSSQSEDNVVWKFDNKVGRVKTKERLTRLGVVTNGYNICVLCNKEVESVEHLFLLCEVTWQLWCFWLRSFGREWVIPGTLKELFESWGAMPNRRQGQKMWMTAFFTVMWNVWLERNARIFNHQGVNIDIIQTRTLSTYTEWNGRDPVGG
ncbi:uncharacterized protein [Arachis hypogaea]|uniref:uncharacterized protein n=1 Tax=Arachis hypogaea TaxID=3818 RepID=UPI000DECEEB6|nr:uncharacterized protein LOC112794946 [Arachis hypogaea]